jgi:hypothetical protein
MVCGKRCHTLTEKFCRWFQSGTSDASGHSLAAGQTRCWRRLCTEQVDPFARRITLAITLLGMNHDSLAAVLDKVTDEDCRAPVDRRMIAELKFGACLPGKLAHDVLRVRLSDFGALQYCLQRTRKWIRISD